MIKRITFSLLLIQTTLSIGYTQESVSPSALGENHTIYSNALEENRSISVYLPDNYQNSKERYSVLYILDGQRYFLNGVLYQKTLTWQEKTPEFIVVGINTDNVKRRKLLYEESHAFIQFLEQELIPHIDKNYRTSSKRLFFGWEMAGGLAIELLAQPQGLFSAYFVASPTHIDAPRLDSLKDRLIAGKNINQFIYFTISPVESWSIPSLESLSDVLEEHASENLIWKYKTLEDENHHSTPTKTIHEGLNKYFSDYPYIRFYSLKEYDDFGGISAVKEHYKIRGKKYDLSTDIHKDTKHFLLLQSMKEDNYDFFDFFMQEFGDYYKSKTRDSWFNRYAQFYLKHQNPDKALEILNTGLESFQNSPILLSGLGDIYLAKGKKQQAKKYYKQAIEYATINEASNLDSYKSKLDQL